MNEDVSFSIIVGTRNHGDLVMKLVESLLGQSISDWELIIVDQSDVPLRLDGVSQFSNIKICYENPGLSRARNHGASLARCTYLLFSDDDCWFDRKSLENLREAIRKSKHREIAYLGRVLDQKKGQLRQSPFGRRRFLSRWKTLVHSLSAGIVIPSDLFRQLGGFDERLGLGAGTPFESGEDADLLLRVLSIGGRVEFLPEFSVYHPLDLAPVTLERVRVSGFVFGALMRKYRFGILYLGYCMLRSLGGAVLLSVVGRVGDVQRVLTYGWARILGYVLNPLGPSR